MIKAYYFDLPYLSLLYLTLELNNDGKMNNFNINELNSQNLFFFLQPKN